MKNKKRVQLTIDGMDVNVPEDYTILQAAKQVNIKIPTLCFLKDVCEIGCCRMCLVEVEGAKNWQASCVQKVAEGMVVKTHTPDILNFRKKNLELILSNHPAMCQSCNRGSTGCELKTLANTMDTEFANYAKNQEVVTANQVMDIDNGISIMRDPNRCILCRRCISVCHNVQTVGAIDVINRGFGTVVSTTFNRPIDESKCVNCGQCINVCPTGALQEHSSLDELWEIMKDSTKHVVVQTAPAVRAALGEEFDMPLGIDVTGKMVTALRMIGFDKVFDTDTGADLTIMEEGTELLNRLQNGGKLPLITSCSPGWIKFCEHFFPDMLDNLSSCKSPHEMLGAMIKSYYAEKAGIDSANIAVVSVMPCTAKKFEAQREELAATGYPDVDLVLTTRELAKAIQAFGIDFPALPDSDFDNPLGVSTGAATIFGATGGVMEAALRTVADIITGESSDSIDYMDVRGKEKGIKEVELQIGDVTIKAAAAHGLGNARALMERIQAGEHFDFVEVMACPGGCVNGGGQPQQPSSVRNWMDLGEERAKALYRSDHESFVRKSHKNPVIKELYKTYLEKPGSEKAHHLLHTHYHAR
ncbi:MAG: 4Fe-4S binding protein [Emergencia sp.]|nr:4Fe-4S binding protein [Emergencia sp.]